MTTIVTTIDDGGGCAPAPVFDPSGSIRDQFVDHLVGCGFTGPAVDAVAAKALRAVAVTIVAKVFISSSFQFGFPGIMIAFETPEMKCPFGMISMHSAHDHARRGHACPSVRGGEWVTLRNENCFRRRADAAVTSAAERPNEAA